MEAEDYNKSITAARDSLYQAGTTTQEKESWNQFLSNIQTTNKVKRERVQISFLKRTEFLYTNLCKILAPLKVKRLCLKAKFLNKTIKNISFFLKEHLHKSPLLRFFFYGQKWPLTTVSVIQRDGYFGIFFPSFL